MNLGPFTKLSEAAFFVVKVHEIKQFGRFRTNNIIKLTSMSLSMQSYSSTFYGKKNCDYGPSLYLIYNLGPGCSKLTPSLVNVSLKFQALISEIRQYFLLKKCEKLLHCKSFSRFFNKKYQCI